MALKVVPFPMPSLILLLILSTAACQALVSDGSEFVGEWQNIERPHDTIVVSRERGGRFYVTTPLWGKLDAQLEHDGTLASYTGDPKLGMVFCRLTPAGSNRLKVQGPLGRGEYRRAAPGKPAATVGHAVRTACS